MRKLSKLAKFGGCLAAAIALCSSAHADLVGLRVFREEPGGNGPAPSGPERWIYRVYAEFSSGNESAFAWGVHSGFGPGSIQNFVPGGLANGFTNIPDDISGNTSPPTHGTARDWDTFMTIGVLYGEEAPDGNDLTLTGQFSSFIPNGSTLWNQGFAVLANGSAPQGRADYRVSGNDTDRRVLLMQLVVNAGEHVAGTIGVSWQTPGIGAFTTEGLTFNIPAPGALALNMAGLVMCRTRRRR